MERLESNPMQGDIWQLDLSRGLLSRLTSDPAWDFLPLNVVLNWHEELLRLVPVN